MKKIIATPGVFDSVSYTDESGKQVGYGIRNVFGDLDVYDADGNKVGSSISGILQTDYYDTEGNRQGYSVPNLFGRDLYNTRDEHIGESVRAPFSSVYSPDTDAYGSSCDFDDRDDGFDSFSFFDRDE